jgi:DNA processing protein
MSMMNRRECTPDELLGTLSEVERRYAPKRLFLAGDASLASEGTRVAIVGSRKASEEALRRSAKLARRLVEAGVTVVSGLALGVDSAAHQAALDAGGRTLAVLGTPLGQTTPARNRELQARIMNQHLAVSQFQEGSKVFPSNFPLRNRTMALLSEATVIVAAEAKSGTESQAWEAIRLGRALFILRSLAVRTDEVPWVEKVLEYGAHVLDEENLPYVLEGLPSRSSGGVAVAF